LLAPIEPGHGGYIAEIGTPINRDRPEPPGQGRVIAITPVPGGR
jgi:hypothetical protein